MNAALVFDLWNLARRFATAKGVLQDDRVVHCSWCPEAEALGHDCRSVPDGFHLAAVRIEPARNNSEHVEKFERGLWEVALRERAKQLCEVSC